MPSICSQELSADSPLSFIWALDAAAVSADSIKCLFQLQFVDVTANCDNTHTFQTEFNLDLVKVSAVWLYLVWAVMFTIVIY